MPGDRITSTQDIIETAKRAKTPGPNAYKTNYANSSRERRVRGCSGMKSKTDQLQMFNDRAYASKLVPGHKYKINYESVDAKQRAVLYIPRTKESGSGPGLKRLEKDKKCGPGQYTIKYSLIDKVSFSGAFSKSKNVNFLE